MKKANEGWEHIPLVKLSGMLKQMIWFSGECVSYPDKSDYEEFKEQFKDGPNSFRFIIEYRGKEIEIECIWEVREGLYHSKQKYPDRFAIGVLKPFNVRFQTQRLYVDDIIIYKYSRYYSTAIDKIEDLIYDAQEVIDKNIVVEEGVQKRTREVNVAKGKLCKSFDVKITSDDVTLFYREDNDYCLNFVLLENGFYEISCIGGEYTEAEIKKIVKLVGGNLRAIAERLSK